MSITPPGGWGDPPRQDSQYRSEANMRAQFSPEESTYKRKRSYLSCKICDSGTLSSKSVFRMSGPAVAIGFILLIPSIIGMIVSALMFVGVIAYSGNETGTVTGETNQPYQSTFDANFRQSCVKSFRQNAQMAGVTAPQPLTEQYCECALSTFKQTSSETIAAQTCIQRVQDGTLDIPNRETDAYYSQNIPRVSQDSSGSDLFRVLGSISAVALGIMCFVGGLLGWLLVMRKRILQCDICGAVVNAS